MKHLVTFCAIVLVFMSKRTSAQLYFDKKPYNSVYSEIQFAHLPDPELRRKGHIFFIVKRGEYDRFAISRSVEVLKRHILPNLPLRYGKNKYRYTNHQINEDNLAVSNGRDFKTISDTLFACIIATRNIRRWSWRKFSMTLRPVGTDTLYQGFITSLLKIQPSRIIYDLQLFADSAEVSMKAKYGTALNQTHSTFGLTSQAQSLILPINELLPRQHYLVHGFQDKDFNIALTKEGLMMYSIIRE